MAATLTIHARPPGSTLLRYESGALALRWEGYEATLIRIPGSTPTEFSVGEAVAIDDGGEGEGWEEIDEGGEGMVASCYDCRCPAVRPVGPAKIPTCLDCGAEYLDEAAAERADRVLGPAA